MDQLVVNNGFIYQSSWPSNIIGISGKIGSGKDTLGKIINEKYYTYEVKKFGGKLKQICSILTGIEVEKFEDQKIKDSTLNTEWDYCDEPYFKDKVFKSYTVREFLQKIGTEAMRDTIHPNVWVNALFSDYNKDKSNWIITDVRFPNEVEAIKKLGGQLIRINRPNIPQSNHYSETALDDYKDWDVVIENTGTLEELKKTINSII